MLNDSSFRKPNCPAVTQLLESARSTGEQDSYRGKRASLRIVEALQLEVTITGSRLGRTYPTTMQNVSETGCAFWMREKLDPGTKVRFREFESDVSQPWIEAVVARCTQGLKGYLVGVRFHWSED